MADDPQNRMDAFADDLPTPAEEPRRPLNMIALLPSAATLGNLLSGVFAIFCCLLSIRSEYHPAVRPAVNPHLQAFFPSYIATGCYLIVAAMVFDALDGRLARLARRTSEFGAQLDSLADVVSFGVAPALLLITLLLRMLSPAEGEPLASKLLWRTSIACCVAYVSCAAIRLARYNAENISDESAQKRFSGLPSPGAAAAFAALLLLHEDLFYFPPWGDTTWAYATRWVLGPAALCLGMLMVSRLNYVHFFNVYARREHPPTHLVWLLFAAAIGWFSPQILIVVLAYAYVLSGPLLSLLSARRRTAERVHATPRPSARN